MTADRSRTSRGATLLGYALVVSTVVVGSLGAVEVLTDQSEETLVATGGQVGTPRPLAAIVATSVLDAPPDWAEPTVPPTTAAPTSSTAPTTSSTTAPTTASTTATTTGSSTTAGPSTSSTSTTSTTAPTTTTEPKVLVVEDEPFKSDGDSCLALQNNGRFKVGACPDVDGDDPVDPIYLFDGFQNPDGTFTIGTADGRCLAPEPVTDGVNTDAQAVIAQTCDGSNDQKWIVTAGPSGGLVYQNVANGQCLDVWRDRDGATLRTRPCDGTGDQEFELVG